MAEKQDTHQTGVSSETLWQFFCDGDESAFAEIMRQHQQNLIFFLRGYVHSYESAEDLAEDTFVDLLMHPGRFRGQSSFKTYLYAVARHKAIDELRRQQRRPQVPLDEIAEQRELEDSPEDMILRAEQDAEVRAVFDGLPEAQREILHLLYVEKLHYDEIATILKKSKKQVDNLSYRARGALRAALGKKAEQIENL